MIIPTDIDPIASAAVAIVLSAVAIALSVSLSVYDSHKNRQYDRLKRKEEKEERKQEQANRKKKLRNALYSELGYTYCTFRKKMIPFLGDWNFVLLFLKTHNNFAAVIDALDNIMTDGFDVYKSMKGDPVLFYQLQDAFALADVYRTLNLSINELRRDLVELNVELPPPEEKKIAVAQKLERTLNSHFYWVTGVMRLKLLSKKIDIDLLTQFISDEGDKDVLRKLASTDLETVKTDSV